MDQPYKRMTEFPAILKSDLLNNFANELVTKLIEFYPSAVLSNAFVADQFNIRSNYEDRISRETARRWMKAESMPEYSALFTLRLWLGIDINAILAIEPIKKIEIKTHQKNVPSIEQQQAETHLLLIKTMQAEIDGLHFIVTQLQNHKNIQ